jgi:hypothetical protein
MKTNLWTQCETIDVNLLQNPDVRYRGFAPETLHHGRELLAAVLPMIPATAAPLADAARLRTNGRFHSEACALAKLLGVTWRDIIFANISYDLFLASLGCSTMALPSPSGPIIARNMDWAPEAALARASVLCRSSRGGKLAFANAGWPGSVGVVSGLSARGFGLVINAVTSPEGANMAGYPVLLFLRTVLEDAPDFDGALKMLTTEKLAMSGMITLVGVRNEQRVVVERSPTRHALRWGEPDKPLLTTNHYRTLYPPEASCFEDDTTCYRYNRMCELLSGYDASVELKLKMLLDILADSNVIQEITAQHVIMQPSTNSIRLFAPTRLLE